MVLSSHLRLGRYLKYSLPRCTHFRNISGDVFFCSLDATYQFNLVSRSGMLSLSVLILVSAPYVIVGLLTVLYISTVNFSMLNVHF